MIPPFLIPYGEGAVVAAMLLAAALILWQLLDNRELKRALRAEIDRADQACDLREAWIDLVQHLENDVAHLKAGNLYLTTKLSKYERVKGPKGRFVSAKGTPEPEREVA